MRWWLMALLIAVFVLANFASPADAEVGEGPNAARCPRFLPQGARCWSGQSQLGGYYWIAMPANWNGVLVVHAHGGPRLGHPAPDDPLEDMERFSSTAREGFAWAGSTYRRGGYGVRMAAEDTDDLRRIFWERFGRPQRTLLHGQSWGGNVAAKAAELYARDAEGETVWDGVIITNGVLAGGTRAYGFRADLRAVYQYYCRNHPRANEPQYPLWRGLPDGATMTREDLAARVRECTGVGGRSRNAIQRRNLADILAVTGVTEDELVPHLAWGTFMFRDMVGRRLDGRNPFDNSETRYAGSHDDEALNAGVERFSADPEALAQLGFDSDLTGLIAVPTLTIHAKFDPTAFVSHEAAYGDVVARAGRSHLLLQTFTSERDHSRLSTAEFVSGLTALMRWLDQGRRPTRTEVAELCSAAQRRHRTRCYFDLDFRPPVLR